MIGVTMEQWCKAVHARYTKIISPYSTGIFRSGDNIPLQPYYYFVTFLDKANAVIILFGSSKQHHVSLAQMTNNML